MRLGSRRSGKQRASRSATPSRRSAIANSITPPSEVRRPPSKAAATFLPQRERQKIIIGHGERGVGGVAIRIGVSNQILRYISALRYARQPKITPVTNKMG